MKFWNRLVDRFRVTQEPEIDWEALLLEADFGISLAERWSEGLRDAGISRVPERAEAWLRQEMTALTRVPPPLPIAERPEVLLLVGVNGSGKTTTAAKLAARAQKEGRTVRLGAADTFRAAATEQLQAWGTRLGLPTTSAPAGTDPAAVAVRSLLEAQQAKDQLLIIDTAGRQANKHNLLQELSKIKRSLKKKVPSAPHHTWLVADGMTGSGVLQQARDFQLAVGLSGLILTKLDGSGRGGMIAAVRAELNLPTYYIGRGERLEDLTRFEAREFVEIFFAH